MDRRSFLRRIGLGAVAAGAAIAVPQLVLPAAQALVEPNRKIFLPPAGGWPVEPRFPSSRMLIHDEAWHLRSVPNIEVSIHGFYDPEINTAMATAMNSTQPSSIVLPNGVEARGMLTGYTVDVSGDEAARYSAKYVILPESLPTVINGEWQSPNYVNYVTVDGVEHHSEWGVMVDRGFAIERLAPVSHQHAGADRSLVGQAGSTRYCR